MPVHECRGKDAARHPLAGLRQASKQPRQLREQPVSNYDTRMRWPNASVSSFAGCDESHQTPIGFKQAAMLPTSRPGGGCPAPEELWYRNTSMGFVQIQGLPNIWAPIYGWLVLQAIRLDCISGWTAARHPIQIPGAGAQSCHGACRAPSPSLCKAACRIERCVILQNMEACAG